ncbi:2934_t:CDS:10 [Diversispora eburnea]|uniref:2934_t:CDS:1 n=1 Tax=Diversispora eburnea TaxID=1213867 RepID=A0A9N9B5E9_9GLOM|nr:2934_t:CDS:10 [Diversispora eburnea]
MSTYEKLLYFSTGLAGVLMIYSVNQQVKRHFPKVTMRELLGSEPKKIEDELNLDDLAELTISDNLSLRNSAIHKFLPDMINCCNHPDPEIRMKAVITLQLLSRNEENKARLAKNKALEVLVRLLKVDDNREYTHRYAAIALYDLIAGDVVLGIIPTLANLLGGSNSLYDSETKSWSLMVIHQLSLYDRLHPQLVKEGFIPILANMSWQTFGSSTMPKYCLQALARKELNNLLDCNIVGLLSACLRNSTENSDDGELLYWSMGLLHEFVIKDVGQDKFRKMKGLLKFMSQLLLMEDSYISKIVLRSLKFLSRHNANFQEEMIYSGITQKIISCLNSHDDDVSYLSLIVLQDLARYPESHQDFIESGALSSLITLATSDKPLIPKFHSLIVCEPGLIDTILHMLGNENEHATACLLIKAGCIDSLINILLKCENLKERLIFEPDNEEIQHAKILLSKGAANLITSFSYHYQFVRNFILKDELFFGALIKLWQEFPPLAESILLFMGTFSIQGGPHSLGIKILMITSVWKKLLQPIYHSSIIRFYGDNNNGDNNDNGRYAYEIILRTDGLMQLGWATKNNKFDPEGGTGVGDDKYSYSYDGHRKKKWNDREINNGYGEAWLIGDIITCAIDVDEGIITFYRNGENMGIAFTDKKKIPNEGPWFPALSLSTNQSCRVHFGGILDPLKYLPDGYSPIASVVLGFKFDLSSETIQSSNVIINLNSSKKISNFDSQKQQQLQQIDSNDPTLNVANIITPLLYYEVQFFAIVIRISLIPGILINGYVAFVKMYTNLEIKDGDYIGWGVSSSDSQDVYSQFRIFKSKSQGYFFDMFYHIEWKSYR